MALTGEKFSGENIAVTWDSSDVEDVIIRSVTINVARDSYDKTGAGDTAKGKHPGKPDYTMTIDLLMTTRDADIRTIFNETETEKAFVVYPNGNTAGEPSRSGNGFVTSVTESVPHNDMAGYSINVDVDGAITYGTVSS